MSVLIVTKWTNASADSVGWLSHAQINAILADPTSVPAVLFDEATYRGYNNLSFELFQFGFAFPGADYFWVTHQENGERYYVLVYDTIEHYAAYLAAAEALSYWPDFLAATEKMRLLLQVTKMEISPFEYPFTLKPGEPITNAQVESMLPV